MTKKKTKKKSKQKSKMRVGATKNVTVPAHTVKIKKISSKKVRFVKSKKKRKKKINK